MVPRMTYKPELTSLLCWFIIFSYVSLLCYADLVDCPLLLPCVFFFFLRKKGSKTKERMKEEEIEKGDCGPPTRKVFFFFFFFVFVLSDLNQAVPNHLADESQTR